MVIFAFSCFGILLFLWLQFGGATPLKPEKYVVKVGFPEAVGLLPDVDVRTAGITIGTVRDVEIEEESKRAVATLALDSAVRAARERLARDPAAQDAARRDVRRDHDREPKDGPKLPDGGRLADSAVAPTVELDEILQTYDETTRRAFQVWQHQLGIAVGDRGEDLSNALNRLPAVHRERGRPARDPRRAAGRGARPRARHGRGLRRAHARRGPARRADPQLAPALLATRRRSGRASRRRSTSSRRSSRSRS